MSNQKIKLKRKVQLREKAEEPIVDTRPHKFSKWIWGSVAAILVVVLIGGYLLLSKSDKVAEETASTKVVAKQPTMASETEKGAVADENTTEIDSIVSSENITVHQTETQQTPIADLQTSETSTILADPNVTNDVEAEAMKVIRGDYGIGQERKNKLGVKYQTIQARVNELKREGVF